MIFFHFIYNILKYIVNTFTVLGLHSKANMATRVQTRAELLAELWAILKDDTPSDAPAENQDPPTESPGQIDIQLDQDFLGRFDSPPNLQPESPHRLLRPPRLPRDNIDPPRRLRRANTCPRRLRRLGHDNNDIPRIPRLPRRNNTGVDFTRLLRDDEDNDVFQPVHPANNTQPQEEDRYDDADEESEAETVTIRGRQSSTDTNLDETDMTEYGGVDFREFFPAPQGMEYAFGFLRTTYENRPLTSQHLTKPQWEHNFQVLAKRFCEDELC